MSAVSIYEELAQQLYHDFAVVSPGYTLEDAVRDREYVIGRSRQEGASFQLKTLPALGKHFESALQAGSFTPIDGFKRHPRRTTPSFMGALFKEVFNDEGVLLNCADYRAVRCIRQACYFMYKLEERLDDDLVEAAITRFRQVDAELPDIPDVSSEQGRVLAMGRDVITAIFRSFDPRDILCLPGPGASASESHRSKRYEPMVHFSKLHEVYPYYDYFYIGRKHLFDRLRAYRELPRKEHGVSRLRCVPKDSRGPRIICMEPQEYMWLQQGLAKKLRDHLESHWLTRGHVNFNDQTINQSLARAGSIDGSFATLDMKDASDRISRNLVEFLFSGAGDLSRFLLSLSTGHIEFPDGETIKTKKFAPMGSSLCFPVMSIVHFALAVASIKMRRGGTYKAIAKDVYVYGDDIIVTPLHADPLFEFFPKFGLEFNKGKSFIQGPFRESCGFDAFHGECVTPQRLKKRFYHSRSAEALVSALQIEYQLRRNGYSQTANCLRRAILHSCGMPLPEVSFGSPVLGFISDDKVERRIIPTSISSTTRFSRSIQCTTVIAPLIKVKHDSSMYGSWERLLRACNHVQVGDSAVIDERFTRVTIERKRVPASML